MTARAIFFLNETSRITKIVFGLPQTFYAHNFCLVVNLFIFSTILCKHLYFFKTIPTTTQVYTKSSFVNRTTLAFWGSFITTFQKIVFFDALTILNKSVHRGCRTFLVVENKILRSLSILFFYSWSLNSVWSQFSHDPGTSSTYLSNSQYIFFSTACSFRVT